MADVRALFTESFNAGRSAFNDGDLEAADKSLRAAVTAARSDNRLERELAAALLQLGKVAEKRGQGADAEELLSEALTISERIFGMEHAGLAPLLSDLGRLHIQQGHHTRAAAALERLLGISRAKGEDRPEVATALAGLALVKRRIGDEEAAEGLYRDALRIREKVLEPGHMGTVVTMEQLSETCAARGKHAEALALLQRALPTREAALGPEHATVAATRARIAALQGEIAKAAANDPGELVFLYKPEPVKRRQAPPSPPPQRTQAPPPPAPQRTQAPPPPRREEASLYATIEPAAAPLLASPPPPPPRRTVPVAAAAPAAAMPAPRPSVQAPAPAAPRTSTTVHRDVVRTHDVAREATSEFVAPTVVRAAGSHMMAYAAAGVAAVAVAAAVFTIRSRDTGSRDAVAASAPAPAVTRVTLANVPERKDAPPAENVPQVQLQGTTTATPAPAPSPVAAAPDTATGKAAQRARQEAMAPELPAAPKLPVNLPKVNVPVIASADVDSILRASTKLERFSKNDQLGAGLSSASQLVTPIADARGVDSGEPTATRPRIIGRAPNPRFPESLRATHPEGEVIVRFEVDERGHANVGGMTVVRSSHELFTAAVRNVLPLYRFEPAHMSANGKPVAVWVELPFKFSAQQ